MRILPIVTSGPVADRAMWIELFSGNLILHITKPPTPHTNTKNREKWSEDFQRKLV